MSLFSSNPCNACFVFQHDAGWRAPYRHLRVRLLICFDVRKDLKNFVDIYNIHDPPSSPALGSSMSCHCLVLVLARCRLAIALPSSASTPPRFMYSITRPTLLEQVRRARVHPGRAHRARPPPCPSIRPVCAR